MRKGIKKIQFHQGQDATESIMRKLLHAFLMNGKIETTKLRARHIKSGIDRLVTRAKTKDEASKNVLLRHLAKKSYVEYLFDVVAPSFADRPSGYVTYKRLPKRQGDNADVIVVSWMDEVPKYQIPKTKRQQAKAMKVSKKTSSEPKTTKEAPKKKVAVSK